MPTKFYPGTAGFLSNDAAWAWLDGPDGILAKDDARRRLRDKKKPQHRRRGSK